MWLGKSPVSDAYMKIAVQESDKLVYVGKIISLEPIEGADFIVSATVVCGKGGKWKGIVKKDQFEIDSWCNVYLPDALIQPNEAMQFMEATGWRVKMRRFKGAPSEVVIMPVPKAYHESMEVGTDLTLWFGVTKYHKPIPTHLNGIAKGYFPDFIPKTDEPNYQKCEDLVDALQGKFYYVTEKADGSSTTAYRYKGNFGVCSRNVELLRNEENGFWKVAIKYKLEEKLPDGIALQWETCGPGIQKNPMGLSEIDGFAFSAYDIVEKKYLEFAEFLTLIDRLDFPTCKILDIKSSFDKEKIATLGEGKYSNGHEREGVVVRSQDNIGHAPISFKVINLNYEK